MVEDEESLPEKLNILLKEQKITIASIVTAVALLISTIVQAVTGGSGAVAAGSRVIGGRKGLW